MIVELMLRGIATNNNGSMSIKIRDHVEVRYFNDQFKSGEITISCCIEWPTCVIIDIGNKYFTDTVIHQNVVVADKAIEINSMLINRFPVQYEKMESLFNCVRHGSDIVTHENYWGFNGQVFINFNDSSPMRYMLAINNPFEINRINWIDK